MSRLRRARVCLVLSVLFAGQLMLIGCSGYGIAGKPGTAWASPRPTEVQTETPTRTAAPTRRPTWTPFVVTSTPTPEDVLTAASRIAEQTRQVQEVGTATPTPRNMVTATFTPKSRVVTNTPEIANQATADYLALVGTAVALTTGTADPRVPVITATPSATPQPTATPTPVVIYLRDLTATATPVFPSVLVGKILFLSDVGGGAQTAVYMMNADGSEVAKLTGRWPYDRAKARDAVSSSRAYGAYTAAVGAHGGGSATEVFYYNSLDRSVSQATSFGKGIAWSPAWSPTSDTLAFVSNETGNDEVWVVAKDSTQPIQLTHNTWEWDRQPSWSPDGKQIVFSSDRDGKLRVWLMDADGGNQHPISDPAYNAWDPVWVKYPDS